MLQFGGFGRLNSPQPVRTLAAISTHSLEANIDTADRDPPPKPDDRIQIGELSRRTGISPEVLRAWERRYGLLQPERTPGGFRLYFPADERRARMMRRRIDGGVSAAEAARRTLADLPHQEAPAPGPGPAPVGRADPFAELRRAIDRFDGEAAHEALDRLSQLMSLDSLLTHGVAPYLAEAIDPWEASDLAGARQRFATPLLRGRLLERARAWQRGDTGSALLACAPGQHSDVALICCGVALNARGWSIRFLGADVPFDVIAAAAEEIAPDVIVVDSRDEESLIGEHERLRRMGAATTLYLSCEGMRADDARTLGVDLLPQDPVRAARRVASRGS